MSTGNFHHKNMIVPVLMGDDFDMVDYAELCGNLRRDLLRVKNMVTDCVSNFGKYHGEDKLLGYVEVMTNNNKDVYATIYVTINGGYYEGSCLDYDIVRELDYVRANPEAQIKSKVKAIRKVLLEYGREYVVTAKFSNGETIYEAKA